MIRRFAADRRAPRRWALWMGVLAVFLGRTLPGGDALPPWRHWIEIADPAHSKSLESLFDLSWRSSGGKEGVLTVDKQPAPGGGRCLRST